MLKQQTDKSFAIFETNKNLGNLPFLQKIFYGIK